MAKRRNPEMLPDGRVVLTLDEMKELLNVKGGSPFSTSAAPRKRPKNRRPASEPRKFTAEQAEKFAKRKSESTKISTPRAKSLSQALGTMEFYDPESWEKLQRLGRGKPVPKELTHRYLFDEMGVNYNLAGEIIAALAVEGLNKYNRPGSADHTKALSIFEYYMTSPAVAKQNSGYSIPSIWPEKDYQFGPEPRMAHYTSYAPYAYAQFYRPNTPRTSYTKGEPMGASTGTQAACNPSVVCPTCHASGSNPCVTSRGNPSKRPHRARRRVANRNPVSVPPSSWPAKPVPWPVAENAGPFVPEMYPGAVVGYPATYALNNPLTPAAFREKVLRLSVNSSFPENHLEDLVRTYAAALTALKKRNKQKFSSAINAFSRRMILLGLTSDDPLYRYLSQVERGMRAQVSRKKFRPVAPNESWSAFVAKNKGQDLKLMTEHWKKFRFAESNPKRKRQITYGPGMVPEMYPGAVVGYPATYALNNPLTPAAFREKVLRLGQPSMSEDDLDELITSYSELTESLARHKASRRTLSVDAWFDLVELWEAFSSSVEDLVRLLGVPRFRGVVQGVQSEVGLRYLKQVVIGMQKSVYALMPVKHASTWKAFVSKNRKLPAALLATYWKAFKSTDPKFGQGRSAFGSIRRGDTGFIRENPKRKRQITYGPGMEIIVDGKMIGDIDQYEDFYNVEFSDGDSWTNTLPEAKEFVEERVAKLNPISEIERAKAAKSGGTLTGGMGWPVKVPGWSAAKNRAQALTALRYMRRGFGNRAHYPKFIRKLATLYPVSVKANSSIWEFYRRERSGLSRWAGVEMPTIGSLRSRGVRAAANPG